MRLGDIVTVRDGSHAGFPHVVVAIEMPPLTSPGRVKLCYCGSKRFYVPRWFAIDQITIEVEDTARLRLCRGLLASCAPEADGWRRLAYGRDGQVRTIAFSHVALETA